MTDNNTEEPSSDSLNEIGPEQQLVIEKIDAILDRLSAGMPRDTVVALFGDPSKETENFLVYLVWDPATDPGRSGDYGVTIYLEDGKVSEWAGMGIVPSPKR